MVKSQKDILFGGILLLLWVLPVFFINPNGSFPLNDDWCFALLVKSFVQEGKFNFTEYPIMTLIGHTLMGSLVCFVTGFSFTALRVYVIALGFLGVVTTYTILNEVQDSKRISFIGSLLLAFNPLYFSLSYTYMTDIPFFCASALSCLFFLKTLNYESKVSYTFAIVFSLLAVSIRQPGIVFPAAFGLVYLIKKERNLRSVVFAIIPFLITASVFVFYEFYFRYKIGYPENSSNSNLEFLILILSDPLKVAFRQAQLLFESFVYMGLFLLPVLLLVSEKNLFRTIAHSNLFYIAKTVLILFTVFFILLLFLNFNNKIMPFEGNILYNFGLGPYTLHDVFYSGTIPFHLRKAFWLLLTFTGIAGGFFIAFYFFRVIKSMNAVRNKDHFLFAFVALGLYFPLVSVVSFFDRYLLIPMLLFLVMILSLDYIVLRNKYLRSFSFLLIFAAFAFSVLGTKDYLSWNRARWQGLNYLTQEKKISPEKIDGGYEFNGWYGYRDHKERLPGKSWWWVDGDEYMITLRPLPGYTVFRKLPYQRYIPYRKDYVYILKK